MAELHGFLSYILYSNLCTRTHRSHCDHSQAPGVDDRSFAHENEPAARALLQVRVYRGGYSIEEKAVIETWKPAQ